MISKQYSESSVGRPARISKNDIARMALTIGLDTFTVKMIGTRLGMDHSSLYRHIKSRKDITFAAIDLAVSEISLNINTDDWEQYLICLAESVWDLYEKYPGLASALRGFDQTPPTVINAFKNACIQLESYGFISEEAALIIDSIMDMTTDSASGWEELKTPNKKGVTPADNLSHSWEIAKSSKNDKHIDYVISIIANDPKQWWRKKLSLLITGAKVYLMRPVKDLRSERL